jgi:hypothetical protein
MYMLCYILINGKEEGKIEYFLLCLFVQKEILAGPTIPILSIREQDGEAESAETLSRSEKQGQSLNSVNHICVLLVKKKLKETKYSHRCDEYQTEL